MNYFFKNLFVIYKIITDVAVESLLERWPYSGLLGLAKLIGLVLFKMQGVSNPPAKNTNSMSVLMLMT